jgi:hypothetical protein
MPSGERCGEDAKNWNANLPLPHQSNADESTIGGDVAIVALPPIRNRPIARLEYINIKD